MPRSVLAVLAALALAATGCAEMLSSAMGSAANATGNAIGQNIGARMGASINAAYPPPPQGSVTPGGGMASAAWSGPMMAQMMTYYTGYIFGLAFGSGGYEVTTVEYKPGQYTRWNLPTEDGSTSTLERAYLFADKEGNQWWKVKFVDGKDQSTIVLEGLLDPKGQKMLRLRGKFPNDAEGKEMAVTENTYYVPPTRLTKQSIEGAKNGTEKITVPAGSFTADRVVYGDAASTHVWWLAASVPGGTVKQELKSAQQDQQGSWKMELAAFGSDAKSELGIKP